MTLPPAAGPARLPYFHLMNNTPLIVLLAINLAATAGLAGWMLNRPQPEPPPPSAAPALDSAPFESIATELHSLNTTLQRLNTSTIQYQFLDKELDGLANLERALAVRAQTQAAARTDDNAADIDRALGQIREISAKVNEERKTRRQLMLQLIAGLERQLAGLSGAQTVTDKVPAEPVSNPDLPSAPAGSDPAE